MSSTFRNVPDKFLVAFSFAGEHRELVRAIAEAVEQRLGRGTVFYDAWFESQLAGSAADLKLQRIYSEQSELVVVCASQAYGGKAWPIVEWDAIRARHMILRADPDRQAADRILPLRVADGEVEGLLSNTIWVEARNRPAKDTAGLIVQRLRQFIPEAGKPSIFLAECTSDLEDPDKPVNRQRLKAFLEEVFDWCVLPRMSLSELPADQYRSGLEADLRQCLAFAQLLGPYPWKGRGYDRVQFDAATQRKLPTFRFRGDVDLDKVKTANPAHHQFITDGVIGADFEDFKYLLCEKLTALAQQREQAIKRAQDEEQGLVVKAARDRIRVRTMPVTAGKAKVMVTTKKIFISYRRDDSGYAAHSIYDKVKERFGAPSVVFDVDTIPLGVDFVRFLDEQVSACDVLLAVVGDGWLTAANPDGRRRLHDPNDFVRIEIASALARGIPVVPVLVGKASMPREEELPEDLKKLTRLNATEVRTGSFIDAHLQRLLRGVEQLLTPH